MQNFTDKRENPIYDQTPIATVANTDGPTDGCRFWARNSRDFVASLRRLLGNLRLE